MLKDSGDLVTLRVDCGRGFIVECKCCDCVDENDTSESSGWNLNQKEIWNELLLISGLKLQDKTSHQYKAAQWIVDDNTFVRSSSYLPQYYVLLIFYFMIGDQTTYLPDLDEDECDWERIGCNDEGYVQIIKFGAFELFLFLNTSTSCILIL